MTAYSAPLGDMGFVLDRSNNQHLMMFSPMGGVDIEEVAEKNPDMIFRYPIHPVLGLLDWLPVLGRILKVAIYRTMIDRYIGRVYSQPNLMAAAPVVPELIGFLTPALVADKVLEVFGRTPLGREPLPLRGRVQSPRGVYSCNGAVESDWARMRADLRAVYEPFSGAAERAVAAIARALG